MQGVRRAIRFLRIPSATVCQLEKENPLVQSTELVDRNGVLVRSARHVSEFLVFGSSVPTCNGSHLHDYGCRSQVMGLCTQTTLQGEGIAQKKRPGGDPQKLYQDVVSSMEKRIIPQASLFQELIRSSSTPSDVALAMDAADRLRMFRTVKRGEKGNHSKEITHMMVAAYLRSNDTHNALKLLWRNNPSGFTSSIGSAHLLLKHAKFHKDIRLMRRTLHAMAANDIRTTQTTADIILRLCKEANNINLMFSLARNYNNNGLTFHDSLFDVLISTTANAGDAQIVYEIQDWRDKQGLLHTTASAISMAKAFVLDMKPTDAAMVIQEHCPDGEKRERQLRMMVKLWPLQLIATQIGVKAREDRLRQLKDDVVRMFHRLRELGLVVSFDVGGEFAQGTPGSREGW